MLKRHRITAEPRPLSSVRMLGELEESLRSLPALTAAEVVDFAADMDDARTSVSGLRIENWSRL